MKFLHLLDLGTCVSNSSLIQCLSWRTGFVKARHFSYQIQALYTADRPICWPIKRKTMSALAHTFALGACVLSFLAYRLSIMADLLGRNLLCSRLSSCLFQTCWHLAGPHALTDLARFKQWTGRGFCCSAIARLIGLPLQLDCMVWESPGFLVFHQTSPKKSHKAFQYWNIAKGTTDPRIELILPK